MAKNFQSLPPIILPANKKVYFASDFHLGIPNHATSLQREKLICNWLENIAPTAEHIFLLGDLFDAWIEYKLVVPKYFTRFLGTLAKLSDAGIPITVFVGNHDLWMYGYFEKELNIPVLHEPVKVSINSAQFLLGHGDGLGPGDAKYKALKKLMTNKVCQKLFSWLHPDVGVRFGNYFSQSGYDKKEHEQVFLGEKEFLIQFCKAHVQIEPIDYFVFGHRHYKLQHAITPQSTYINLGDWLQYNSYGAFDGTSFHLLEHKKV
jgi:UDP-2,3-diacylglucosamine hydrolase